MMIFRGDISHPKDETRMAHWEMTLYDFSKSYNSSLLELLVLGDEVF